MTAFTIKEQYEYKKKTCLERSVDFNFSLDAFEAFWKLRGEVNCFYTDKPMKIVKSSGKIPDDYATMERLDSSGPYDSNNTVWVRNEVNQIKSRYIENEESMKGKGTKVAGIVARIKKVLNNPQTMERKLNVYREAYKELDKVKTTLAEENLKAMEEQKQKEAQIAQEKATEKRYEDEVQYALHYAKIAQEFSEMGVVMEISIGELRKKFNCIRCQITGVEFKSVDEKYVFVVDLAEPITKDNIVVVTYDCRQAMYTLLKGSDMKTVSLNIHKLENKG